MPPFISSAVATLPRIANIHPTLPPYSPHAAIAHSLTEHFQRAPTVGSQPTRFAYIPTGMPPNIDHQKVLAAMAARISIDSPDSGQTN